MRRVTCQGFPCKINERPVADTPATGRTSVNLVEVIHRSSDLFPTVDNHVDNARGPRGQRYFHCVETPNPPAMNAKPMTMFQLPMAEIGQAALDT